MAWLKRHASMPIGELSELTNGHRFVTPQATVMIESMSIGHLT